MTQELTPTIASSTCAACNIDVHFDDRFCERCGYPLKGTDEDQKAFINVRDYKALELHEMNRKVHSATQTLYILAALCVGYGIFQYAVTNNDPSSLVSLFIYLVIAAIYLGLALWSKKQPLSAIVSGLVLYLILQVLATIDDPVNLVKGILIKIAVIVYLAKGISSAADAQRIKRELFLDA